MKVPLSWLRDLMPLADAVEVLVERLPMLGLGVDGVETVGDDVVLDLEVASNRPDLLSLVGVAREIAASQGLEVTLPAVSLPAPGSAPPPGVAIDDPVLCPRFTAHVIANARVRPSPAWMRARLEAAGIRAINNVVDVTNYVMLEQGQPMHAFDLARLAGRRLVVRLARPGERLTTLDGIDRELDDQVLVVADAERAQSLAGIIGGEASAISEDTDTVLLEAATWAPAQIRRTSRRLGVRTESSARFERRVDPRVVLRAAQRAVALLLELTGGTLAAAATDIYPRPVEAPPITLRAARIPRLLGLDVPPTDVESILRRLGCEVRRAGGAGAGVVWTAAPPPGRIDLEREEDLIEEVIRHYGYERLPETLPVEAMHQGRRASRLEIEASARDALIRAGLTEAFTVSLLGLPLLARLGLDGDDPWSRPVPLRNPLTADHTHLRPCLLPGLLEAVRVNVSHRREAVHLFELGRVFGYGADGGIEERRALAVAIRGPWLSGVWRRDGGQATFAHLRGVLETFFAELRTRSMSIRPARRAWLHPYRAGEIVFDGGVVGAAGELHPDVAARYDLPGRTFVAELAVDGVLDRAVTQPRFSGFPRFPAVRRDVAVVAPDDVPQMRVEAALREIAGTLLESVELFDVYAGPPLARGQRNLAYTLIFRAPDRTLAGDEVDRVVRKIHEALPERLPVTIRL
jgi:phenylalanyl-tRNA synthetase beta chain